MINHIINFVNRQMKSPDLRTLGLRPKPGLHIKVSIAERASYDLFAAEDIDLTKAEVAYYDDKSTPGEELDWFVERASHIWYVSSNKAIDRKKRIHTASPYCVAFRRESLPDVIPPDAPEKRKPKGKKFEGAPLVFKEWFEPYFETIFSHVQAEEIERLRLFQRMFYDRERLMSFLQRLDHFHDLDEKDYVSFYLDEPLEKYERAHRDHLSQNLFNTTKYNLQPEGEKQTYGTSDFLTGYNSKKPFLEHQRAPFDVGLRITQSDA